MPRAARPTRSRRSRGQRRAGSLKGSSESPRDHCGQGEPNRFGMAREGGPCRPLQPTPCRDPIRRESVARQHQQFPRNTSTPTQRRVSGETLLHGGRRRTAAYGAPAADRSRTWRGGVGTPAHHHDAQETVTQRRDDSGPQCSPCPTRPNGRPQARCPARCVWKQPHGPPLHQKDAKYPGLRVSTHGCAG